MPISKELRGKNLIDEALGGRIMAIAHGCNCFCTQGKGIAFEMSKFFDTHTFPMEQDGPDINKLGCIDYKLRPSDDDIHQVWVINMYTQYHWGKPGPYGIPLDYDALRLCFRKLNDNFKGNAIGIPGLIGCGLGKGNPEIVKKIINEETPWCSIIIYYPT